MSMPCRGQRGLLAVLAGLAAAGLTAPASAQNLVPEKGFYVTDDVVEAIEVMGDSVYVGGRFTHVGPYTGPLGAVTVSGGTMLDFPEVNDQIWAVAPDGEGGWFVGGDFTEIDGQPRAHAAHLLADLTVDPDWHPDPDGRVRGFLLHDGLVYLHGYFDDIGEAHRNRIASVDLATGAVTDWNPDPTSGGVEDFFADGDLLYVVGSFQTIGGQERDMAAFDLTTGELTGFDPVLPNDVLAVVAKNDVVYVGGRFTTAADSTRSRLAAFDAATAALLPWNPDVSGSAVFDLVLGETTLYAGGSFSVVGGNTHRAVVELDLATGIAQNTIGGTIGQVFTLAVHGNRLYLGGDFTELHGEDRRYLGAFDRTTGDVLPTPAPLDVVRALGASGDTLVVGGEFGSVSGVDRNRFAAFHASTLELLPWAPDFDDIVWRIEGDADQDTLYVCGRFDTVDGALRTRIASFDRASGALTSLSQDWTAGDVYDIAVADSLLYIGGTFSAVGGAFRADLCAVDRVTGALSDWNPGSSGIVNSITAWNDTVWIGGGFAMIGDSARVNVAAVDGFTGQVLDWGSALSLSGTNEVEEFFPVDHPSFPNGAIFMGGDFLNLGIGLRRG
ncbi:MAG TPA: hypothetical protein VKU85_20730, partial [bacterium]|nr:hypothetical protein [bacterium]